VFPGTERSYRVTDVNREGDALLASVTLIDLTELGDDESPTILVRRRANRVGTGLSLPNEAGDAPRGSLTRLRLAQRSARARGKARCSRAA
jgi:hypothetical protein